MNLRLSAVTLVTAAALAVWPSATLAAAKPVRPVQAAPLIVVAQAKVQRPARPVRRAARPVVAAEPSVTIMTEALPATAGSDEDLVGRLARGYASAGLPRVLPMRGLGPIANMRDLLHMRGIDMAVVNADILAYARLTGELPGAAERLSVVLKLYDKSVYIVAGGAIATFADLTGRRVVVPGKDSDSTVTATTLFRTLNMSAEIAGLPLEGAIAELASGKAAALLVTLEEDDATLAALPKDKGLHLLTVPQSPAIAGIWGRRPLKPGDAHGLEGEAGGSALTVASVLATFNWRPSQFRYPPVLKFLGALPAVVADLRSKDPSEELREIDGRADVPGWTRYAPAKTMLANLVSIAQSQVAVAATPAPTPAPEPRKPLAIEIAAREYPVFSEAKSPRSGLIGELALAALKAEDARLVWQGADASPGGSVGARLTLPVPRPDCGHPATLAPEAAEFCRIAVFSAPVFQALQVFFVRQGSEFTFETDADVAGRTICAAAAADTAPLDAAGRDWVSSDLATLIRRPSLAGCFAALDRGEADAVFTDDLTGRTELAQLGLTGRIEPAERPVATIDLVAYADKSSPPSMEALKRLDLGLAALKADGRYGEIVLRRLGERQLSGDLP